LKKREESLSQKTKNLDYLKLKRNLVLLQKEIKPIYRVGD